MKVMLVLFSLLTIKFATDDVQLSTLRQLYYEAAEKKSASISLSKLLDGVNERSLPLMQCYRGAAYMMEAKYAFNPITKLNRFHKGKQAIENAVKKSPDQLEIRFIRFSIQNNLPSFLGYQDHIEIDKQKLLNGVPALKDLTLKKNITDYLIASKKCTKEELKKLQQ